MTQYRKKPVVIEAVQFERGCQPDFLADDVLAGNVRYTEDDGILFKTPGGVSMACPGDWIIRSANGDLHLCNPQNFAATYEAADTPPTVVEEIAAERRRQIEEEGCTAEHDDQHDSMELAQAAAAYALCACEPNYERVSRLLVPGIWPRQWDLSHFKPKDRRRDLVRAAALIVAEIERLDRAVAKVKP